MLFKKLSGLFIIILMLTLTLGSAYSSNEYDKSSEGKVAAIEQSIRNIDITDLKNSTYFNNLSTDRKNLFLFIYNKTGDTAIATEVMGQAGRILSADDMNFYTQYINGNAAVVKSISDNVYLSNRIGYINKQISDWEHLTTDEKVSFFDTDKHDLQGALDVVNRFDQNELIYVNGNMMADEEVNNTGYDAVFNAFTRLNSLSTNSVTDKDIKLFEDGCDQFTNDIFKYHQTYMILTAAEKDNVTAMIMKAITKNPKQLDVTHFLINFKTTLNDNANRMYKLGNGETVSLAVSTGIGATFVTIGIITVIAGCFLGPNPTIIVTGVGFITMGVFLLASTPSLPSMVGIRNLGIKMQDFVENMNPIIDKIIDGIQHYDIGNNTGNGIGDFNA
jgi:hypothetical protein